MDKDVRSSAVFHIGKHFDTGHCNDFVERSSLVRNVVKAALSVMRIDSPESCVTQESRRLRSSGATSQAYGLALDGIGELDQLRRICQARGILSPRMLVINAVNERPAHTKLGLVYMPKRRDPADQGMVVWVDRWHKVEVVRASALGGEPSQLLDEAKVRELMGAGFERFVVQNLSILSAALWRTHKRLMNAQTLALAGVSVI